MIKHTDFFHSTNHFVKIAHVESLPIKKAELESPPLITIAIPTYKRADLLKEAIGSALNQNYEGVYEVLVVDNNPERKDDTELLMCQYAEVANVSYYKNSENVGMVNNWNKLYQLAQGKWVVMLHDDDMLSNDYLEKVSSLLNDDCGMVACRYRKLQDGVIAKPNRPSSFAHPVALIDFAWGNCIGAPVGVLMSKEKVLDLGGFDDAYYPASDYCFFARMAKEYPSYIIHEQLSIYRMERNASFRKEVLDGFMRTNYHLSNIIWNICGIPSFISKSVQVCRIKKQIKSLRRNWDKNYSCSEIPVTDNPLLYWASYFMYKVVYLNLIRYRKRIGRIYYACQMKKLP